MDATIHAYDVTSCDLLGDADHSRPHFYMLQAINLEALTRSVPVDANERSDRERIVMQISLHESTDHCCWTWRDAAEFLGPAPLAQAA